MPNENNQGQGKQANGDTRGDVPQDPKAVADKPTEQIQRESERATSDTTSARGQDAGNSSKKQIDGEEGRRKGDASVAAAN